LTVVLEAALTPCRTAAIYESVALVVKCFKNIDAHYCWFLGPLLRDNKRNYSME